MNAGRDVERLIADWLVEEAPTGAPDRILPAAGRTIDSTRQRRFGAAWREPMIISTSRLVLAAAVVLAAVVGAGLIGRSTATAGQEPTTAPIASPAAGPTGGAGNLEAYRTARNGICSAAMAVLASADVNGLFDPEVGAQRRSALNATAAQVGNEIAKLPDLLAVLDPPADLAIQHQADVARQRDVATLFQLQSQLLGERKYAEAQAVDTSANVVNEMRSTFETRYGLTPCP
jgi:hypothetical protein